MAVRTLKHLFLGTRYGMYEVHENAALSFEQEVLRWIDSLQSRFTSKGETARHRLWPLG